MENRAFEDVFPIENSDFPLLCLITGVYVGQICIISPRRGEKVNKNKMFETTN